MARGVDPLDPPPPWSATTLLGQVSPLAQADLVRLGAHRQYDTGEILIHQGAEQRFALLLLSGFVKITVQADSEQQILLTIRGQGDLIGDLAALSGQRRSATVVACTPIKARLIFHHTLREFTERNREVGELIIGLVVTQLHTANRRRVEFATRNAPQRLASVLLELAATCGKPLPDSGIQLPNWFSQTELANLVGSSEDSVQRALRDLRTQGMVSTGYRQLTIIDPEGLAEVIQPTSPS